MSESKNFFTYDFESFSTEDEWNTAAFVVVQYPSGTILEHLELGFESKDGISEEKWSFWKNHPQALEYNRVLMQKCHSQEDAERSIFQFVTRINKQYPNLHAVSDHISYDSRMLDGILKKYNQRSFEMRAHGKSVSPFTQTLCTWSFRTAMASLLRYRSAAALMKHLPERSCELSLSLEKHREGLYVSFPNLPGCRHTPLYDAFSSLRQHFCLLDLEKQHWRNPRFGCSVVQPPVWLCNPYETRPLVLYDPGG